MPVGDRQEHRGFRCQIPPFVVVYTQPMLALLHRHQYVVFVLDQRLGPWLVKRLCASWVVVWVVPSFVGLVLVDMNAES